MEFQEYVNSYTLDSTTNNYIHKHFTEATEANDFLFKHRSFVEQNKLGFGDRAFHFMWYLLLLELFRTRNSPKLLEIGVYKGQVISLWKLIAKRMNQECDISCITPLSGNPAPRNKIIYWFKYLTSNKFRAASNAGNFYASENYLDIIKSLFEQFDLEFKLNLCNGLSNNPAILSKFEHIDFDLIYIDGDHSREAVEEDIVNFAPKVKVGGFLVMDDASCNIPGGENNEYWKGHQSVSDACEIIPTLGFVNVLNVGHNRLYQKI